MTWLVEQGIGEERAFLRDGERIVAARTWWPGEVIPGMIDDAVLVSRAAGSPRGTARLARGETALVDRLPASAREGAPIRVEITRPAMGDGVRRKLARARVVDAPLRRMAGLAEQLRAEGEVVQPVHDVGLTDAAELAAEALAGEVAFPGGALLFSPTPAMLLVDIDGTLDPRALALAAVQPLAAALRRFDVGGNIGIDFPTVQAKADRRAVDEALATALAGWPHERTAMNGFGFVQLVARLARPSLLHRAAFQRDAFAARALLRRAERLQGAGALELGFHPSLALDLTPWIDELQRRTGREVRLRPDPVLAPEAPHAQLVTR